MTGPVAVTPASRIFLRPETLYCSAAPSVVTTVLGSCVSLCLWDRVTHAGGINHFLLPDSLRDGHVLRYGLTACDQLVAEMVALGCRVDHLEAKLFGGAAVLYGGSPDNSVGTRNVEMALARLHHHRIPIRARRTGGDMGLWIQLATQTFEVLIRPIPAPGQRIAADAL